MEFGSWWIQLQLEPSICRYHSNGTRIVGSSWSNQSYPNQSHGYLVCRIELDFLGSHNPTHLHRCITLVYQTTLIYIYIDLEPSLSSMQGWYSSYDIELGVNNTLSKSYHSLVVDIYISTITINIYIYSLKNLAEFVYWSLFDHLICLLLRREEIVIHSLLLQLLLRHGWFFSHGEFLAPKLFILIWWCWCTLSLILSSIPYFLVEACSTFSLITEIYFSFLGYVLTYFTLVRRSFFSSTSSYRFWVSSSRDLLTYFNFLESFFNSTILISVNNLFSWYCHIFVRSSLLFYHPASFKPVTNQIGPPYHVVPVAWFLGYLQASYPRMWC